MNKKTAYTSIVVLLIAGIAAISLLFPEDQTEPAPLENTPSAIKQVMPGEQTPVHLNLEPSQGDTTLPDGQWIHIADHLEKPLDKFSVIISLDVDAITGALHHLNSTKFFLKSIVPDHIAFTIIANDHLVSVTTAAELRRTQKVVLSRSPTISGSVFLVKEPVKSGSARLFLLSKEHEKTARRMARAGLIQSGRFIPDRCSFETPIQHGLFSFPLLKFLGSYKVEIVSKGAGVESQQLHVNEPAKKNRLFFQLKKEWIVKGDFIDPDRNLTYDHIQLVVYPESKKIGNSERANIYCHTRLNRENQFEFKGTEPGLYRLVFQHFGVGVAMISTHFVKIESAKIYNLGTLLAPPEKIFGSILDQDSKPVPDVEIWGGGTTPEDVFSIPSYRCKTDPDGQVRLRLNNWNRLSVHIDERTIPKKYGVSKREKAARYLDPNQRRFQFRLQRTTAPVHFIFPEHMPVQVAHILSLTNNKGYIGSGGFQKDEQRAFRVFPFAKIPPGEYKVLVQTEGAPYKQNDWYGGRVTIPRTDDDSPIQIHFDEQNRLETTSHSFEITGDKGCTLLILPKTKAIFYPFLKLKGSTKLVIKLPKGIAFTMKAPGFLLNGDYKYEFPRTGSHLSLKIKKEND